MQHFYVLPATDTIDRSAHHPRHNDVVVSHETAGRRGDRRRNRRHHV